jgi:hypothetical protein
MTIEKLDTSLDAELEDIQIALVGLIKAAWASDAAERKGQRRRPVGFFADEIAEMDLARWKSNDYARNPVGTACRDAIRKLGKRLHKLGGEPLMEKTIEIVAATWGDGREGAPSDMMDKHWDGIGSWIA